MPTTARNPKSTSSGEASAPAPALPNRPSPGTPVLFDADVCTGCNRCVEVCQVDVLLPHPEKGNPPILLYPDECWYEGSCVEHCPRAGAIRLNPPLAQRVRWRRKATGESFRV